MGHWVARGIDLAGAQQEVAVPGRLWDVYPWDVPGASMGCGGAKRKRKLKVSLYEWGVAQVSHLDIAQLCRCGSPRSRCARGSPRSRCARGSPRSRCARGSPSCATVGRPDLDVPLWVAQI
jgi:hypothetical protein